MVTIYYYIGKKRNNLTARIMLGRERLLDKGTGIIVNSMNDFDVNTKRFTRNNEFNKILTKFEASIDEKIDNLKFLYRNEVIPPEVIKANLSGKVDTAGIVDEANLKLSTMGKLYGTRSRAGLIFNKKTGKPLSPDSIDNNEYQARLVEIYLTQKGAIDFDFGRYNSASIAVVGKAIVKNMYNDFVASYKNFLIGRDLSDGTMYKNMYRMKRMINYFVEASGVEIGELLSELKYPKPSKEVIVLAEEQTMFILKNYDKIRKECNHIERDSFDYWFVALMLNPRRKDMGLWNKDNLFEGPGGTWIRYIPNKTKGTSGRVVETMVPDTLKVIFDRNLQDYNKLMPPLRHNLNLHLKRIAKRYDIFHNEIQILKKGKFIHIPVHKYVHIHMMRSTGISHKLTSGWGESFVKEVSGHTHDSESFKRYVKISNDAKQKVSENYYKAMGL
jgi:hypothetical protein